MFGSAKLNRKTHEFEVDIELDRIIKEALAYISKRKREKYL